MFKVLYSLLSWYHLLNALTRSSEPASFPGCLIFSPSPVREGNDGCIWAGTKPKAEFFTHSQHDSNRQLIYYPEPWFHGDSKPQPLTLKASLRKRYFLTTFQAERSRERGNKWACLGWAEIGERRSGGESKRRRRGGDGPFFSHSLAVSFVPFAFFWKWTLGTQAQLAISEFL